MCEEGVEYIIARSNRGGSAQSPQEAVVWKLVGKAKCADFDLALDFLEALTRSAQIGLRRWTLDRGAVANSFEYEVEIEFAPRETALTPSVTTWYPSLALPHGEL